MLVWLSEFLAHYFHVFHVVEYLTLRMILGALTALTVAVLIGPYVIRRLTSVSYTHLTLPTILRM